ncbi:hypothetical protein [Cellulomonas bogoriensis]|uniref:Uncharacterized protein n=1 Tax=Cellulomonas bogoriensis 69B4 = DSM 16987 TaxID=1386082 RepID=A0A0A0BXW3_9CELL|nr:hypothetical protein [Cellulomonas bogoriensis]KGM12034.1 hypothetical protein N869_02165 [Cellulomonas bogoriensis 69B4 = DSM 16987]
MQVALTVEEGVALALAVQTLPPFIGPVRGEGRSVLVDVDLAAIPDVPTLARLSFAAVGSVTIRAALIGYDGDVATFELQAEARGLPAHRLLNHLTDTISDRLRANGLPDDLVELHPGPRAPLARVHVQQAIDARVRGLSLATLDVRDGVVHAGVTVGDVALH